MANSASLLFPVSNLTNLLALPYLDLDFVGFAARMAPVLLVVLLVEYAGLRLLFRRELAAPTAPVGDVTGPPVPVVPVVVVALMLVGFAVLSRWDVAPAWVSGRRGSGPRRLGRAPAGWSGRGTSPGPRTRRSPCSCWPWASSSPRWPPGSWASSSAGCCPTAPRRTSPCSGWRCSPPCAASLLTNLSATILLVPLVAPLGTTAVLAALLGLNIGSGLTWTGSLANLLWRRTLVRGRPPGRQRGVPPRLPGDHPGLARRRAVADAA